MREKKAITCEDCLDINAGMGEEPECDSCPNPVLLPTNYEAWQCYSLIANQFVYDFHAVQLVFDILNLKLTREQAILLLEKLIIIHRVMNVHEEKDALNKTVKIPNED